MICSGAVYLFLGSDNALRHTRGRRDRLERGAGAIFTEQRTVEQRTVGTVQHLVIILKHIVYIIVRICRRAEQTARLDVKDHDRSRFTALSAERRVIFRRVVRRIQILNVVF